MKQSIRTRLLSFALALALGCALCVPAAQFTGAPRRTACAAPHV